MTQAEFAAMTDFPEAVVSELCVFRDMILERRQRANLVGPSFQYDFWRRHALDSAQLFHVEHEAIKWADVGAGAGFPGVVLAILMKDRNKGEVHLVESQAKRVGFLRDVCRTLDLPAVIHHCRAEELLPAPKVDIVTARACAPLERLLNYTRGFFKMGAEGLFLKGKNVDQEVAEALRVWNMAWRLLPSQSDSSGRILSVSKVSPRG